MDGFLLKPYSEQRLRRLLAELRDRRREKAVTGAGIDATDASAGTGVADFDRTAFSLYARAASIETAAAVHAFVAAVEREIELLQRAAEVRDLAGIAQAAHRLRSLGGLIGARDLGRHASRVEALARAGELDELRSTQKALTTEWQRLRGSILEITSSSDKGGHCAERSE